MTTAVATASASIKAPRPRVGEVRRPRPHRAATLAAAVTAAWEDLLDRGRAECLVCGGELRMHGPGGGECGRCGSLLD